MATEFSATNPAPSGTRAVPCQSPSSSKTSNISLIPSDHLSSKFPLIIESIQNDTFHQNPLSDLMNEEGSDKGSVSHNYTSLYFPLIDTLDSISSFAEIGIGAVTEGIVSRMPMEGYVPGASIRGWRRYFDQRFSSVKISAFDVDPNAVSSVNTQGLDNTFAHWIDQTNPQDIDFALRASDPSNEQYDIILDDGLHTWQANIMLLTSAWKHLKKNGLYLIEDISSIDAQLIRRYIAGTCLDATFAYVAIPCSEKSDNRIIVIQKNTNN